MINVKFVATITIDGAIKESEPDLLPIDQIRKNWKTLGSQLTKALQEEMPAGACVKVETVHSEVWQTEDDDGKNH